MSGHLVSSFGNATGEFRSRGILKKALACFYFERALFFIYIIYLIYIPFGPIIWN